MKLRPVILIILLFLIPSIEAQEDLYQSAKEYRKPYLVVTEVINYLRENHDLSWLFFEGDVSIEHSVQKQELNLRLARSKLKEFDHLLNIYSELKVVSKAGVEHKSIMLNFFDEIRPEVSEMLWLGELVLQATKSNDFDALQGLSGLQIRQRIFLLASESAVSRASIPQIEVWHPARYRVLCNIAGNDTLTDVLRFTDSWINEDREEDLILFVRSAEQNLRSYNQHIRDGFNKTNEFVPMLRTDQQIAGNPELLSVFEEMAIVFVDVFRNELGIANSLTETVAMFREIAVGNAPPSENVKKFESTMSSLDLLLAKRVDHVRLVNALLDRSLYITSQ